MSDYTKKEVELFGKKQTFRALSGVVIKREQRSDTHVTGSGSSSSYGGYGGGNTTIQSTIKVTTNIWIRGASGAEHHLQFKQDMPAIEGNVVHLVDIVESVPTAEDHIFDEKTRTSKPVYSYNDVQLSDGPILLYNSASGEWHYTGDLTLSPKIRNVKKDSKWWLAWYGGMPIFGFLLGGIGFGIAGFVLSLVVAGILASFSKDSKAKIAEKFKSGFSQCCSDLDDVAKKLIGIQSNDKVKMVEFPRDTAPESVFTVPKSFSLFCTSCGTGVEMNAAFCGSCGTKMVAAV